LSSGVAMVSTGNVETGTMAGICRIFCAFDVVYRRFILHTSDIRMGKQIEMINLK